MSGKVYDTRKLGDNQILDLLSLGLESQDSPRLMVDEFRRLAALSSGDLVQNLRKGLGVQGLNAGQAAQLLGVSELTAKRWFESSGVLAENAQAKLAGLCLLLSLASDEMGRSGPGQMVRSAVTALRKAADSGVDLASGEAARIVTSVFGVAGLMAAALHLALTEKRGADTVEGS